MYNMIAPVHGIFEVARTIVCLYNIFNTKCNMSQTISSYVPEQAVHYNYAEETRGLSVYILNV